MSRKTLFVAVVVACLVSGLAPAAEAQKQMTAFLRLEGIAGESADTKHRGDIDIESFGWSESQSGQGSPSGGGRASERVNAGSFQFSAYTSLASPRLFQACAMGQRVKTAVLTIRNRAGLEYMTWRLTDVSVRDYKIVGDTNRDARTRDEFSLEFSKIEFEYRTVQPNGQLGPPVKAGWDAVQNRPF